MKETLKALASITTGLVVGEVVRRVGKRKSIHENGFLLIDIDNTTVIDVINEYSRIKNKRMVKNNRSKYKLNAKDFSLINLDVSKLVADLSDAED